MIKFGRREARAFICKARDTSDKHAHVIGDEDFGDCGHTDGIGANALSHTHFSGGLIFGAVESGVDAFTNVKAENFCGLANFIRHIFIVSFGHIGEAGPKFIIIGANESTGGLHEVNMIGNDHEFTSIEIGIDGTGCVRNNHLGASQATKNAHRERDPLQITTLIVMNASLHDDEILTF